MCFMHLICFTANLCVQCRLQSTFRLCQQACVMWMVCRWPIHIQRTYQSLTHADLQVMSGRLSSRQCTRKNTVHNMKQMNSKVLSTEPESSGVVALLIEYQTCNQEVVCSSLGRAHGIKTLGMFLTPMCLCSPSSTSWYRPKGGDALRLGSKGRYGLCVGGR